jgi:hypothetical protein
MMAILIYLLRDYFTKEHIPVTEDFGPIIIKFSCLISMHLMMEPKLHLSFSRVKFILYHPRNFALKVPPLMMAYMDLITLLLNEICMVFATVYETGTPISIV